MKKSGIILWSMLIAFCFSGCGSDRNEDILFQQKVNNQYASIIWEDREYVPYCAIQANKRGAYLGHMEDDSQVEVYELAGYSSEEWLIDYLRIELGGEAMLYKEISVQNIPDGFYSEYDWNTIADE